MSGQPAATVPCGFAHDDLPIGAQFVGPRHCDALVLRAARVLQQACPFTDRIPAMAG